MEPSAYLEAIVSDGETLAGVAAPGLDRPVPSCPGWDMAKLVLHVGIVHGWAGESVRRRSPEAFDRSVLPRAPEGAARVAWLRSATSSLVDALGAGDDAAPAGVWGDRTVTASFWRRRMAHETAVHRWDAQAAVEDPQPLDAQLAVDGINEALEVLLPRSASGSSSKPATPGTLHVHCTDISGEWLLARSGGRVLVTDGHAKGDAALRGTASELLLACWGRRSKNGPEVLGDETVAQAWLADMGW